MNDNSDNQHSTLDDILKELEERFGGGDNDSKPAPSKKSSGINFKRFTQNQVIGSLTLALLIVGGAVSMFLGTQGQDVRQQASVAYQKCTNSTGVCSNGVDAGSSCTDGTGSPGTCNNDSSSTGFCSCIKIVATATPTPIPACMCGVNSDGQCIGQNVNSPCTSGSQSFVCGAGSSGLTDENGNYYCTCSSIPSPFCPGGVPVNTNTPTRTPTGVPPTGLPTGLPTAVPPTGLPTAIPPTVPPATNTPSRTPTPTTGVGPTCNSIVMEYGAATEQRPPRQGDQVSFVCATGGDSYEFRVRLNSGAWTSVAAIPGGNRSLSYTLAQPGHYSAQCRMCFLNAGITTCQSWETL